MGESREPCDRRLLSVAACGEGTVTAQPIAKRPDLTLSEMQQRLEATRRYDQDRSTVAPVEQVESRLQKTMHASEQECADVQEARLAWHESMSGLEIEKLVFHDETWASTCIHDAMDTPPQGKTLHRVRAPVQLADDDLPCELALRPD